MQDLLNTFLEESAELITNLEDALLTLENNPEEKEAINGVFRVMHTLKGSGSMFGFESITNFTHQLETLYDKIRNGKTQLTTEIINITLKSVDHIKVLLDSKDKNDETLRKEGEKLTQSITLLLEGKTNQEIKKTPETEPVNNALNSYYIEFIPNKDIMINGTNPLYLIDELNGLGKLNTYINTEGIPNISNINPQDCYIAWKFILSTEYDLDEIFDVFIFVDDTADIKIEKICNVDFLNIPEGKIYLDGLSNKYEEITLFSLQNICSGAQIDRQVQEKNISSKEEIIREEEKDKNEFQSENNPKTKNKEKGNDKVINKKNITSIRVSSLKIEELMNLVSELVTNQSSLELYAKNTGNTELINVVENHQKLIRQLRDNALDISLIPLSNLNTRFKRLIRDLSVELKKDVAFIIKGEDTELDKSIIDQLAEPLMHIFRNAIDHGIENNEQDRINAGKPKQGQIMMNSFYSGSDVIIEISDDGKGIDVQKIKESAINKGLINPSVKLKDQEIIDLIFQPGFSTATTVSEISGRGVGMDVVKKKISDLQGKVRIESTLGKGSKFIVKIPLTLSIIDGILCSIDEHKYIIGIQDIMKIYKITAEDINNSFNNMITLDGIQYPIIEFRKKFKIDTPPPSSQQVVVIYQKDQPLGLVVDAVDKEVQVVVKPISGSNHEDEIVSGAAIMGDGNIALVLNTNIVLNQYT